MAKSKIFRNSGFNGIKFVLFNLDEFKENFVNPNKFALEDKYKKSVSRK